MPQEDRPVSSNRVFGFGQKGVEGGWGLSGFGGVRRGRENWGAVGQAAGARIFEWGGGMSGSGGGGRILGGGGGEEEAKEIIYFFRPAKEEHVPGFWDNMGGLSETDGEYFVPGAVDMI